MHLPTLAPGRNRGRAVVASAAAAAMTTAAAVSLAPAPAMAQSDRAERATVRAADVIPGLRAKPLQIRPGVEFLGGPVDGNVQINAVHNANAADTTNADQLRTGGGLGLNLSGSGTIVGVWDGGSVRSTHEQLTGRVTVVDAVANSSHSTHVAGTIGGSGTGNASAMGMAPSATIRSRDFSNDEVEMASDAPLIHLSNHSYGLIRGWDNLDWGSGAEATWYADRARYTEDPNFGKYDVGARDIDQVLSDNKHLLSVWSAGNDRNDTFTESDGNYVTYLSDPSLVGGSTAGFYRVATSVLPAPGGDGGPGFAGFDCLPQAQVAKNTLVVGAVDDLTADPYTNAAVTIANFSSVGSADDGRVRPDVVANGVSVTSTVATADNAYGGMSGTSMAAPNATGTMALLHQHYRNLHTGQIPTSATQKALAIHTAHEAGNAGPDYVFGYGVLDGAKAATFLTQDATNPVLGRDHLVEGTYAGTTLQYQVLVDGLSELKATMVWTDLPGVAQDSNLGTAVLDANIAALVNNLDLTITGPGGTFFAWSLDPLNPNNLATRTSLNSRDNVEQVLIDSPLAGLYTISIARTGASFTQDFSLLYSGAVPVPEPTALAALGVVGVAMLVRRRRR